MSVWGSRWCSDAEGFDDEKPGPIKYQGSHVLPRPDSERGGSIDTAHIPGFLTYDGYDDAGDGEPLPWWPYLRLSVRPAQRPSFEAWRRITAHATVVAKSDPELAVDIQAAADCEDTVILDLAQVDALIADLTEWRANVKEA